MDRATNSTAPADRLFCAIELSKKSWLLGIQFPDREKASVYPIKGGDSEDLMAKLVAARDRWTKVSGKKSSIILCYEAGYDAFWLARFLKARGIDCLVVDSASMQVNRRSRRAKTDRVIRARSQSQKACYLSSVAELTIINLACHDRGKGRTDAFYQQ